MKLVHALLGLLVLVSIVSAIRIQPRGDLGDIEREFKEWMSEYGKTYENEEEYRVRLHNFINNIESVKRSNQRHQGKATFAINKFSDLSLQEFKLFYLMPNFKRNTHRSAQLEQFDYPANIPQTLDWRQKSYVTPVKNQEMCGSCWAFSGTEQVETAWIMAGNSALYLSEQQVVDCDPYDGGCGGGDPMTMYKYVEQAGGLTTNASYPYTAENGKCMDNVTTPYVQITEYGYASSQGNETELKQAIAARGPLSVCVNAEPWMHYSSGVLTTDCPDQLDHCVQIVGYDIDVTTNPSSPIPYYIIRNSWGTTWGIEGYLYLGEGSNLCGITDEVTYVEVTASAPRM